jgi:hypothetical protein
VALLVGAGHQQREHRVPALVVGDAFAIFRAQQQGAFGTQHDLLECVDEVFLAHLASALRMQTTLPLRSLARAAVRIAGVTIVMRATALLRQALQQFTSRSRARPTAALPFVELVGVTARQAPAFDGIDSRLADTGVQFARDRDVPLAGGSQLLGEPQRLEQPGIAELAVARRAGSFHPKNHDRHSRLLTPSVTDAPRMRTRPSPDASMWSRAMGTFEQSGAGSM